jgi:hypothetical protein
LSNKEIKLIKSPETQTEWPIPPEYLPLWTVSQIEEAIEGLIIHYGHEAIPTINQADMIGLILRIKHDYDLVYAKALRDLWAAEGLAAVSLNASA